MVDKIYKQDLENCFADKIGGAGIERSNFKKHLEISGKARLEIAKYQGGRADYLFKAVKQNDDLAQLKEIAEKIRRDFTALVVIGTGGSTLNPQTIVALRKQINPDFKIYFLDNIDPLFTENLFTTIDFNKTAFLAISKSGGTIEVLAQTLLCLQKMESAKIADIGRHFFIINDPCKNILRDIGEEIGATILNHSADIGGRFSTFTNVGLLPALVAGLDGELFRNGAEAVVDDFLNSETSYPLQGAALAMCAMEANLGINVFMPYVEALKPFTTWVCQIWAESLGKNGKGSTPVRAAGTLDQHSQLQLYLEGPADKLFNVIGIENELTGLAINSRFANRQEISYINGKYLAQVNMAALKGTAQSIVKKGRPVRSFIIKTLNEESLGAMMMHFTIETIVTAQMMQINAFDQPAVEDGKILARQILGQR